MAIEKKCLEEEEEEERGSYLSCLGRPTCQPAISTPLSPPFPLSLADKEKECTSPPPPSTSLSVHIGEGKINRV